MVATKYAERIAQRKSDHRCHKHAALVLSGKRILAAGWNADWLHAEAMAVAKCKREGIDTKGLELLSIRWRRSGSLGDAKPCKACRHLLALYGFRWVSYSTNAGTIQRERVIDG